LPILVFLRLSVFDLGPMYATDRRSTSDRQMPDVRRASSLNVSALWGRGHNNRTGKKRNSAKFLRKLRIDDQYTIRNRIIGRNSNPPTQGRSQTRISGWSPASGRWARVWVRTNVSTSAARVRGSRPPDFLYIFNTNSCILVHSLAPKIGTTNVFLSRTLCIGGNEDCWKRLLNEARMAENRGRSPRAGWGSLGGTSSPTG